MRRLGQAIGIFGVAIAAAACGSSGSGTLPSAPAAPLQSAAADHMRLNMMRLRLDDLGPNWRREAPALQSNDASKCDPHPHGVKITAGSWKSRGVSYAYGTTAQIHSDAIVFATPADAQKTVAAYMAPSVVRCLSRGSGRRSTPRERQAARYHDERASAASRRRRAVGLPRHAQPRQGQPCLQVLRRRLHGPQDRAVAEFSYLNAFQPAPTSTEYTLAMAIAQRGALG